MKVKARQWLRKQTRFGKSINFLIYPADGGIAGSLVGLGHIKRDESQYTLTRKGARWIGVEPSPACPM